MDIMNLAAKISLDSKGFESSLRDSESKFKSFGDNISSWAIAKGQLIADFTKKAASAAGEFIKGSIGEGMSFDKAMSQVAATMGKTMAEMADQTGSAILKVNGETKEFTGNLEEFARFMGANTAFTATQAAQALNYMALAGYDAQKSMNMLPNVLNLAAAGAMDLGRASDMITDTQTAFGLTEERTAQMVDEMAAAASNSNTSVSQLGDAFLVVGALAQEMSGGMVELSDGTTVATDNIQQMELVLGAMANAGIKGSEAGTHLRNMILKLTSPTKDGAKALEKMGVDVFDVTGEMRSMTDIFTDLNKAFGTMTKEEKLSTIADLFNTRDTASVEALLKAVESGGWDQVAMAITNANGAAQQMADTQLDNLAGDVTKWGSALSEAKLIISEKVTPALRNFVQVGTKSLSRLTEAYKKGGMKAVGTELKNVFNDTIKEWKKSKSPLFRQLGDVLERVKNFGKTVKLAFSNFPQFVKEAWKSIKSAAANLGGLVFGKNEDGSVKWPTWEDVKDAALTAWNTIKDAAISLGTEFGKLVFGTDENGEVKWPTWDEVKQGAIDLWEKVKSMALSIGEWAGKLVFGTNEDGSVAWPTWDDVKQGAINLWNTVKTMLLSIGTWAGKLVFGTNADGSVAYPSWDDVKEGAIKLWDTVKTMLLSIGSWAGKLVFGTKADGSVDFPTWSTVKAKAKGLWETIKSRAKNLKGLVFGDAKDAGSVFDGIRESWEKLRDTIESKAIKIAQYFFDDADPDTVAQAIKTIGDVIVSLGAGLATFMAVNGFIRIVDAIKTLFTLPSASPIALILAGIATAITLIAQNWEEIEPKIQEVGNWVNENLIQPFSNFFSDLKVWISNAVNDVKRFLGLRVAGELTQSEAHDLLFQYQSDKQNGNNLYESGFVDDLRSKLQKAGFEAGDVETIVEQIVNSNSPAWVEQFISDLTNAESKARALADILNGITGYSDYRSSGQYYNDYYSQHSHAKGGSIPYDNYIANLHRGEMVLTASQARDYREGNSGTDFSGLEDRIIAAIKSGMENVTVRTFLNGQDITDEVNRNNTRTLKARRFNA